MIPDEWSDSLLEGSCWLYNDSLIYTVTAFYNNQSGTPTYSLIEIDSIGSLKTYFSKHEESMMNYLKLQHFHYVGQFKDLFDMESILEEFKAKPYEN